jgi:HAD superfamily hydrolase (TIGR01509 family)
VAAYGNDLIADGVRELIGELDASGVSVGLVTSASCWRTGQVVKLLDLASLVSAAVCSDDDVRHKPDPAPYLAAVTKLGVEPAACLVIEDSSRGVQSALAAGVPVLTFVGFGEDREAVAQGLGAITDFAAESPASLETLHRLVGCKV